MLLPPCLLITAVQQVETSSPPFQLKVLRVIDLDVHVLLHQQLLSSVMGQYGGLLAPSGSGGVFLMHAPLHPTPPLFLSVAVHSQALIPPSSFEYPATHVAKHVQQWGSPRRVNAGHQYTRVVAIEIYPVT